MDTLGGMPLMWVLQGGRTALHSRRFWAVSKSQNCGQEVDDISSLRGIYLIRKMPKEKGVASPCEVMREQ